MEHVTHDEVFQQLVTITKAEFSDAVTVMDRIEGWNDVGLHIAMEGREAGTQNSGHFTAYLWMFAKACIQQADWGAEPKLFNTLDLINTAYRGDPQHDWVTEVASSLHETHSGADKLRPDSTLCCAMGCLVLCC